MTGPLFPVPEKGYKKGGERDELSTLIPHTHAHAQTDFNHKQYTGIYAANILLDLSFKPINQQGEHLPEHTLYIGGSIHIFGFGYSPSPVIRSQVHLIYRNPLQAQLHARTTPHTDNSTHRQRHARIIRTPP